jgi:hypothetical protein
MQKLQGGKRIKDPGDRLPLCPRNERTSSWTYEDDHRRREDREAKSRILCSVAEIKHWNLWRGRPPSKRKGKRKPLLQRAMVT